MGRRINNNSPAPSDWTMGYLIKQIHKYANMESMVVIFTSDELEAMTDARRKLGLAACGIHSEGIRNATYLYREGWLNPLLNELQRRIEKTQGYGR